MSHQIAVLHEGPIEQVGERRPADCREALACPQRNRLSSPELSSAIDRPGSLPAYADYGFVPDMPAPRSEPRLRAREVARSVIRGSRVSCAENPLTTRHSWYAETAMSPGAASPKWRAVGVFFVGTSLVSPQRVTLLSARYEPRRPVENVLYDDRAGAL